MFLHSTLQLSYLIVSVVAALPSGFSKFIKLRSKYSGIYSHPLLPVPAVGFSKRCGQLQAYKRHARHFPPCRAVRLEALV